MNIPNIPIGTWEQAGVIVLYVILLIALAYAFGRLLKDQRNSQAASMQAMLKQQQDFIEKRDLQMLGALDSQASQWQNFMRQQREIDQSGLAQMATNIKEQGNLIATLTQAFRDHVVDEEARFDVLLTDRQKALVATKAKKDHA